MKIVLRIYVLGIILVPSLFSFEEKNILSKKTRLEFSFLLEIWFGIVKRMGGELGLVLELAKQCLKI